jgi:hypothetical protein
VDSVTPEIVDLHDYPCTRMSISWTPNMSHVFLGCLTLDVAMNTHWHVLVGMDTYKILVDTP